LMLQKSIAASLVEFSTSSSRRHHPKDEGIWGREI
jgi:hypothetical protein